MEEYTPVNSGQPQHMENMQPRQDVGFPGNFGQSPRGNGKSSKTIKILIGLAGFILIIGIGGFLVTRGSSDATPSPTPIGGTLGSGVTVTTPAPESSPTPTPRAISKSEVKIEVLNGSGVVGEASLVKGALEKLGFSGITASNADSQSETVTTITFSRDLSDEITTEITDSLSEIFKEVRTRRGTVSGGFDVRVLTGGPRKGAAATATPTSSPTPSPSPTSSSSPVPSSTP